MFSLRRRMENATGHEFWTFKKKNKPLYSWLVRLFLVAYAAHTCPCCCFFFFFCPQVFIYNNIFSVQSAICTHDKLLFTIV